MNKASLRLHGVLLAMLCSLAVNAQCPDITETKTSPNCIPSCELCSGGKLNITLKGNDLPHNGKIDYYADVNAGFNPYAGQGVKIGSVNITTSNPKCRQCPVLLGFMIDACGTEAKNEFLVMWTGSGFNTGDFNFDFATQNNSGGAQNADIGPGGCGIVSGNPSLVSGCSATAVGGNFDLPPNSIWIVFTSANASTIYDCTSVCGLACKIFVSASNCDRTIGAFSNFDASAGNRTQVMTITGCACSTTAMYDVPGSLTGNGDFWAEGSISNNNCATPSLSQPNYIPAVSTVSPFDFTIPASWCDKVYEIVGILNPKPDPICCMEEFTERISINVKCPKANPTSLEACETSGGQALFNLEDADTDVLGGSNGTVQYFKDMAGTMRINSPFLSGNATIYAKIIDGSCSSNLVAITLKVILLPIARAASDQQCDDGSGFATFDLTLLEKIIKNGNASASVSFYEDIGLNTPISSPYTSSSAVIYAVISDGKCISKPVAITLTVVPKPSADSSNLSACPGADGKADFDLNLLITKIINGQTGVSVKFYADSALTILVNSPFHSGSDTLYAVVSSAACSSDLAPVFLKISSLNTQSNVTEKMCDDGNGNALFDLIQLAKLLTLADTSIKIKWFEDSLKQVPITPPVLVKGNDTIFAFLYKDSCSSLPISVYLNTVKRPVSSTVKIELCADQNNRALFDLDALKDLINGASNLPVNFAEDSSFIKPITSPYYSFSDTIYAQSFDGNCSSFPVPVFLIANPSPFFKPINDTIVCNQFVLQNFTGINLSANASYYSNANKQGIKLNPGDTIYNTSWIYLYDELNVCSAQDSFRIDVIKGLTAGNPNDISICEGSTVDLKQYLVQADPGGTFADIDNSGKLNLSLFNSSGLNGQSFRFKYLVSGNAFCPADSSIITVHVVQKVNAGLDTTIQICESELYDLNAALRNADAGGLFKDVNVTGALQNTVWDASKSGPGNFRIEYEIGDGISCPKDISQINLQVLKGISISKPADITVCDLFVLPIISGKNITGNAAYFTNSHGAGIKYNPGDTIYRSTSLFVFDSMTSYCPDESSVTITVKYSSYNPFGDITICRGDSIKINNTFYGSTKLSGTEYFPGAAANGCDSTVKVVVLFYPKTDTILKPLMCANDFLTVNGNRYDINRPTGTEVLKGASKISGCDSTITVALQFHQLAQSNYSTNLCAGESIFLHGKLYTESNPNGVDTLKGASASGCDSLVRIQLNYFQASRFIYRNQVCNSDTIRIGNLVFDKNNPILIDTIKGLASNGCDSIRDIQIQFYPEVKSNFSASLCENQELNINGTVYNVANPSGTEVLKNASFQGCDSIVEVALSFKKSVNSNFNATICENEKITINGKIYDQFNLSGKDTLIGMANGACDSIVTIQLQLKKSANGNFKQTICEDATVTINGINYDKNRLTGIDTLKASASSGCDSIVNIQLTLIPNVKTQIRDTLCPEESLSINGIVYNKSNPVGEQRFVSQAGCDSLLTVNLSFVDLQVSYNPSIFISPGQQAQINLLPNFTPTVIKWIPATGLSCSDCLNPQIVLSSDQDYEIELIDANGCQIIIRLLVKVQLDDRVWVPNSFSPNGDNINDFFKVISVDPNWNISDFAIYDRWGNQLYYEQNTTISDHKGWDGTANSQKLNPGVFVYYIKLTNGNSDKTLFGDVSLIR